ncbi:MAG: CAP domain-containing protein [Chloroflexota bacterium]
MVRHFRLAAMIGLLLLTLGHTTKTQAQGSPADEVFRLVNEFRAQYGLPPFTYNPNLAAAAQGHANYLATNGVYSHYEDDGSTPQIRAERTGYIGWAGENYVAGTKLTPQQGVTWWSNSAPHFANMVSTRHTEAGVGYAFGHDQNFYVLVIGEPTTGGSPARTAETIIDVPAFVEPIELSPPNEDGSIIHTVGAGQSVWAIAARYGVSVADIYLFNGLNEDSLINPGDQLVIQLAEGRAPPPTPTPPATYIVQEGESCGVLPPGTRSIWQRFSGLTASRKMQWFTPATRSKSACCPVKNRHPLQRRN